MDPEVSWTLSARNAMLETLRSEASTIGQPIVVIMVKAPRPGTVKTRLVPPLSASDAASLAVCLVQDTVLNARRVVRKVLVAYDPEDARADLEPILPSDLMWCKQDGDNLGERLDSVANHVSRLGFSPLLICGADSPTLPTIFLQEALGVLSAGVADISLGPTDDGGYYLVGLQNPIPRLFQKIAWSTPAVFQQTASNACALNLRLNTLPLWYDVDTPADLARLRAQVVSDEVMQRRAPHTYRWLINNALPSS